MKLLILAFGKIKKGTPEAIWIAENHERLVPMARKLGITDIQIKELEANKHLTGDQLKKAEATLIQAHLPVGSIIVALDERGKTITSVDFAGVIQSYIDNSSAGHITFIIGGADGLDEAIRQQCHVLLSFGKMTWPHKLARVLLMEQIYRAITILSGHPYHRV